ncbi:MAG TPA: fatty acid desaturase [Myxococcota bacterium]|nr:fatty acid desaturase [Myxococcota bacterium]
MRAKPPFDIPTALVLAAMYGLLGGNVWLYFRAPLPWPLHMLIGTLAIHLAFTVWHEAVHRNASRIGCLNDAIGVLGALPYMAPFYLEKWFHLQHHALLNRADDPNYIYTDGPLWRLPLRYVRILRYARARMRDDPRSRFERWIDRLPLVLVVALVATALARGAFVDLLVLWALPFTLSKLVMDWYINWLPHAGLPPDRYAGTRIVDVAWLTPLVLGHNYHAIHHLWPNLPWHRYPATFREKRGQLRERGVPIETRLPRWSSYGSAGRDPLAD